MWWLTCRWYIYIIYIYIDIWLLDIIRLTSGLMIHFDILNMPIASPPDEHALAETSCGMRLLNMASKQHQQQLLTSLNANNQWNLEISWNIASIPRPPQQTSTQRSRHLNTGAKSEQATYKHQLPRTPSFHFFWAVYPVFCAWLLNSKQRMPKKLPIQIIYLLLTRKQLFLGLNRLDPSVCWTFALIGMIDWHNNMIYMMYVA